MKCGCLNWPLVSLAPASRLSCLKSSFDLSLSLSISICAEGWTTQEYCTSNQKTTHEWTVSSAECRRFHTVFNLLVECKRGARTPLVFLTVLTIHTGCLSVLSCCFSNWLFLAVVYLVLFHLSFIMFVWSYWKTIFTRPANPSKEVKLLTSSCFA